MSTKKRRRIEDFLNDFTELIEGDVIISSALKGPYIVIESGLIHITGQNENWSDWEITIKKLRADGTYDSNAKAKKYSASPSRVKESRLPDFQVIKHLQKTYV